MTARAMMQVRPAAALKPASTEIVINAAAAKKYLRAQSFSVPACAKQNYDRGWPEVGGWGGGDWLVVVGGGELG